MGKITKPEDLTFTPLQRFILDEFANNPRLIKQFYFTGGTALSGIFLHHRESEDLDFFTENDFENSVDFAIYPYKRLGKGQIIGKVRVDSLKDIAVNKLQTVTSRTEIKDFVDLFFLLKKFTIWDLIYGVKYKFNLELDLVWLGADFLKAEKFEYLPKMLKPLDLSDLKSFYKALAKKLGKSFTV